MKTGRLGLLAAAAFTLVSGVASLSPAWADGPALFTQQDEIRSFDLFTGRGYQVGTATGTISGTTFVEFQLTPSGPPVGDALPIVFQNTVLITDVDGDQVSFDNNGTGTFHLGVPGAAFAGSGGPLVGIYVVTRGTGKYQDLVGTTYGSRAIMTNPPNGAMGNVLVHVSRHAPK